MLDLFSRGRSRGTAQAVGDLVCAEGKPSPIASLEREGLVTLVDVRPREEYAAGHVPEAISIRFSELENRLSELDQDKLVVAVCRGIRCRLADLAVDILPAGRLRGRTLRRGHVGVAGFRGEILGGDITGG